MSKFDAIVAEMAKKHQLDSDGTVQLHTIKYVTVERTGYDIVSSEVWSMTKTLHVGNCKGMFEKMQHGTVHKSRWSKIKPKAPSTGLLRIKVK